MKRTQLAIMVVVAGLTMQSRAALYNIGFTGFDGVTTAMGQVDVSGGIVTSGFLDVTFNGTTIDYTQLAPAIKTIENSNGDEFYGMDNKLNVNAPTQGGYLTVNGMVFYNLSGGKVDGMIELSDWSPSDLTPNLFGLGQPPGGYYWGNPNTDGTLSITLVPTAVPEPTTMVAGAGALGLALLGIGRARRSGVVRIGK
jgi:hypothetical protein